MMLLFQYCKKRRNFHIIITFNNNTDRQEKHWKNSNNVNKIKRKKKSLVCIK